MNHHEEKGKEGAPRGRGKDTQVKGVSVAGEGTGQGKRKLLSQ